jgi:hypothetical protein
MVLSLYVSRIIIRNEGRGKERRPGAVSVFLTLVVVMERYQAACRPTQYLHRYIHTAVLTQVHISGHSHGTYCTYLCIPRHLRKYTQTSVSLQLHYIIYLGTSTAILYTSVLTKVNTYIRTSTDTYISTSSGTYIITAADTMFITAATVHRYTKCSA